MPRVSIIIGFVLLLGGTLFTTACTDDQIVDMEQLERNLLLTWIALEREDDARATEYNKATQQNWALIRQQYGSTPMSPSLRQSAGRVNIWMVNLRNAINYGQPERAVVAINLMQNELRALRPQLGVNHPADQLYDFYYQWQDVVAASNDQMLCLLEWTAYEERYELALKSWEAYAAARPHFSDTLFPGYGQNAADSEAAGLAMTRHLEQFGIILEQADHTLAAAPSREIEDLFFDYLAVVTAYPGRSLNDQNSVQ